SRAHTYSVSIPVPLPTPVSGGRRRPCHPALDRNPAPPQRNPAPSPACGGGLGWGQPHTATQPVPRQDARPIVLGVALPLLADARSEEHTSELQSREHLVY